VIIVPATTSLTAQEPRSIPTRLRSLLPATIAAHWSLAWSGLDAAEAVTAGLTALVYGIVRTDTLSWGAPGVLAPLALGIALRGNHVNDGGAGCKVFGVEIEL